MASFKDANVGLPDRADAYKQSALAEHAHNTRKESYVVLASPPNTYSHLRCLQPVYDLDPHAGEGRDAEESPDPNGQQAGDNLQSWVCSYAFMNRAELLTVSVCISSFIFQGIIIGTVFLKVPDSTAAYFSRGGILFL